MPFKFLDVHTSAVAALSETSLKYISFLGAIRGIHSNPITSSEVCLTLCYSGVRFDISPSKL